jgi:hypothetical protein
MEDDTKKKLASIVAKKRDLDAVAAERAETVRKGKEERERNRKATEESWPETVSRIRAAIDQVNDEIVDSDMEFKLGPFKPSSDPGSYGTISVTLVAPGSKTDRSIHLNISDVGMIRPVFTIPHSGNNPHQFSLEKTADHYADMLTDFLTQVVDYMAKRKP